MSNQIYWLLELEVASDKRDAGRELMSEMVSATQAEEPGTLNYEWAFSEDGSKCHLFERYSDSDAVLAHLGNFGSKYAERFMACFNATAFKIYGDPSPAVREALAGFGPVYYAVESGFSK